MYKLYIVYCFLGKNVPKGGKRVTLRQVIDHFDRKWGPGPQKRTQDPTKWVQEPENGSQGPKNGSRTLKVSPRTLKMGSGALKMAPGP